MFLACVGVVFRSKNEQFRIICSIRYTIKAEVEVDLHANSQIIVAASCRINLHCAIRVASEMHATIISKSCAI